MKTSGLDEVSGSLTLRFAISLVWKLNWASCNSIGLCLPTNVCEYMCAFFSSFRMLENTYPHTNEHIVNIKFLLSLPRSLSECRNIVLGLEEKASSLFPLENPVMLIRLKRNQHQPVSQPLVSAAATLLAALGLGQAALCVHWLAVRRKEGAQRSQLSRDLQRLCSSQKNLFPALVRSAFGVLSNFSYSANK